MIVKGTAGLEESDEGNIEETGKEEEEEYDYKGNDGHPGITPRLPFYSPWVLARVCKLVHTETKPLLDGIDLGRDVWFVFHAFTVQDMRNWVEKMGEERVGRMKRWTLEGMGWCRDSWWTVSETPSSFSFARVDICTMRD